MKVKEKKLARKIRIEKGLSINEIAKAVRVSQGTVSLWVRDIELTKKQKLRLKERNLHYSQLLNGSKIWSEYNRNKRKEYQQEGISKAKSKDILHGMGCMLYWGEGAKSRNTVNISNSDPHLLTMFLSFLYTCYSVSAEDVCVHIHVHESDKKSIPEIERFWLRALNLPRTCLRKTVVHHVSGYSKKKKGRILKYGTCHLNVHQTRIVQAIYGAIQEYGSFKNRSWLIA